MLYLEKALDEVERLLDNPPIISSESLLFPLPGFLSYMP